jgi:hypothetical protein
MQFHAVINYNRWFEIRQLRFKIQFYKAKESQPSIKNRMAQTNYNTLTKIQFHSILLHKKHYWIVFFYKKNTTSTREYVTLATTQLNNIIKNNILWTKNNHVCGWKSRKTSLIISSGLSLSFAARWQQDLLRLMIQIDIRMPCIYILYV